MAETDDAALVERIRTGDGEAFQTLFRRYVHSVANLAYRYVASVDTARDVAQDVFLNVWRTRETLAVRGSMRGYLYRAARNRALRIIEHEAYGDAWATTLAHEWHTTSHGQANTVDRDDLASAVYRALQDVPPRAREIFLLNREEGLSPGEIAELLGIGAPTVSNQLSRVVKHLAERLTDWTS